MKNTKINDKNPYLDSGCENLLRILKGSSIPLNLESLMRLAHWPCRNKKHLLACLKKLNNKNLAFQLSPGLWSDNNLMEKYEGKFCSLLKGGGFVKRLDTKEEFYIHPDNVNQAWHNDLVQIAVLPKNSYRGGNAKEAKVVKIVKRHLENVPVRVIKRSGRTLLCRPVDARHHFAIRLRFSSGAELPPGLDSGRLLLVSPQKHLGNDLYDAILLQVLGREDDVTVQEDIVKLTHNVPTSFPEQALKEASALPSAPTQADMQGRQDCSGMPFITIDGADARDFDDAVQVSRLENGYILRVAIADASFYVRPGSGENGLDAEARQRGNSWYFPTSVEPMLPKTLSNGLCSLVPSQKRLAIMVEIFFERNRWPGTPRFAQVVIESWARLTYENVQNFFDGGDLHIASGEKPPKEPEKIKEMLANAYQLYKILAAERKKRGSLDFDLPEPKYEFAPDGLIKGVGITPRNDAHKLIEEFMIAANEAVARHLASSPYPFLYRVHPAPEETKIIELIKTLSETGVENLPAGIMENGHPAKNALQEILAAACNTPAEFVVNRLCLRAMPQARYQPENTGHYGLASKAYCHFTSPIRRYADLLVHRALKTSMSISESKLPTIEHLQEIANQLNMLERKAVECEREMTKRMSCLLLQGREGEIFDATVSGVTDFSIFIELASIPVEGMILLEDLSYDWFELDSKTQRLIGQKTGQLWKLGQYVRVRLQKADMLRLELRFLPKDRDVFKTICPRGRKWRQKRCFGYKAKTRHSGIAAKKIKKS